MTVTDLILRLQTLPLRVQKFPIVFADWNEAYRKPSERVAEHISIIEDVDLIGNAVFEHLNDGSVGRAVVFGLEQE